MAKFETTGLPQSIAQQGEPTLEDVTGLTGRSKGAGHLRTLELTLDNVAVALADNAGVVAYASKKLFTMPEGAYAILGAVAALEVTKSSAGVNDNWDGDFALGSAAADNSNSLTSTEQNIIPSTATPQAVSGATTAKGVSTAAAYLDGTTTPSAVYLNALVDDADHDVGATPCNLIFSGTITVHYLYLGNH